jgi:pimeloyl-ACP methyl ester carboxylesterase
MKLAVKMVADSGQSPEKPDFVFLHGTGSNSHMWDKQVDYLNKLGHRCFLVDLRGHGETPERFEKTDLLVHEEDVIETLGESAVRFPAYFVGHSLGAILAFTIARKKPEWVKAIFAASLPGRVLPPLPVFLKMFVRGPKQLICKTGIHRNFAWRERTLFEMDPHTLNQIALNFGTIDLLNEKFGVSCPVHFAAGRFDPVALYWHVLHMHKNLPGSTLITFPWGGHNFMDADSDKFNKWISSKLDHVLEPTPKSI